MGLQTGFSPHSLGCAAVPCTEHTRPHLFLCQGFAITWTRPVLLTHSSVDGHSGGFNSLAVRIPAPRSRILCGPVLSLLLGTCLGMEPLEARLSRAAAPFHVPRSSVRAPAPTLADTGHCQPSWHSPSSGSEMGSACGFRWHFPKCLSSCTPRALGHLLGRNVYLGPLPNF